MDIRKELLYWAKEMARERLVVGRGGNISARLDNKVYIKKRGSILAEAKLNDFVVIELERLTDLGKNEASSEVWMHLGCFKARADIQAIIHAHPPWAGVIATAGLELRPITCEFVCLVGSSLPTIGFFPPGSRQLAKEVSQAIRNCNGVLLAHHGTLVVGENLAQAFYRTVAIEQEAKRFLGLKILGKEKYLRKEQIKGILLGER